MKNLATPPRGLNISASALLLILIFVSTFSISQNPTVISDSLVIMNRVYAKEKLIVDQEAKFKQDIKVLGNARINTNLRVDGELRVDGNARFNSNVRLTNISEVLTLADTVKLMVHLPNGQVKTMTKGAVVNAVYASPCGQTIPGFPAPIITNPVWNNGPNKLYVSYCANINVGIGITSPEYMLDVRGLSFFQQLKVGAPQGIETAMINGFDITNSRNLMQLGKYELAGAVSDIRFLVRHKGSVLIKCTDSNAALEIRNGSGHAAVVYANNGNKIFQLQDDGLLRTREMRIDAASWADYVFDKNYQLPKLKDLAKFIDLNHHLPGVPSAAEIKENGINVGEMQTLQMLKIEELTLYLIEMDQKMELMQTEINDLKEENKNLKNK